MKKLREKDAIWCKTQKQWDSIIEIFNLQGLDDSFDYYPKNCITPIRSNETGEYSSKKIYKNEGYTIHKAKDILKKSFKEDVLKRLEKIEKELSGNTTIYKMESVEPLKFDLPTKELEELPEKWCVVLTEENRDTLTVWLGFSKIESPNGSYVGFDKLVISLISKPPYTEITFDQLKKWVLKEDSENEKIDIHHSYQGYEFPLSIREVQVKVSNQEEANECAEIAKALGEEVKELYNKYIDEACCTFRMDVEDNKFGVWVHEISNFKKISIQEYRERYGKPATEIDWSKYGQLVTNNIVIWITNGNHSENHFEGTVIYPSKGKHYNDINKLGIKLCTEPITLSNERN